MERAASTFAVALHMHQPLIPAGGGLHAAPVISNLAWMMDHQDIGDNHNAPVFVWCHKRMGEFIRQLPGEGRQPRVMPDCPGTVLHGMRQTGLDDVFDAPGYLTGDPRARQASERYELDRNALQRFFNKADIRYASVRSGSRVAGRTDGHGRRPWKRCV
jgi:hypothetical protein